MRKTFLILSVSDRVASLNNLVGTIRSQKKFDDYDISLYFQDPEGVSGQITNLDHYQNFYVVPKKIGCHAARVELLKKVKYDIYINLDDDMELCEYTNYEKAIDRATWKSTGFVLTNWARTKKQLEIKAGKLKDVFVKQNLVYQGGGMVYREEVAELMRGLPSVPQTFDHAWPLTAYINGYINYRYLGSVALHSVLGKGGMNTYLTENCVALMMEQYVNFRRTKKQRGNGHDVCIPLDPDLKPEAHFAHKMNKK